MRIVTIGSGVTRRTPLPNGPTAEVLVDEQAAAGLLAVAHLTIPPRGGMPEHAHGDSRALLVILRGELVLVAGGEHQETVVEGALVLLDRGERVQLTNQTSQPVSALAVFAPPGFVGALSAWPPADQRFQPEQ